jgi:hypothetical protein
MSDKDTNIELSSVPNDRYRKLFDKFKEIDTLPVVEWRYQHLLGYFCRKYKETYNINYAWKFNNPAPSKCFEVWQINVLSSKLSSQPKILKEYIDWAFETIVPRAKRRLTSISFMTKDEVVSDYKMNVLWAGQSGSGTVDRSTPLPDNYVSILKKQYLEHICTYGDLAFLAQMNPMSVDILSVFIELEELGLDRDVLGRIV